MVEINYTLILFSSFAAITSPGPATLAIAGTSMNQGRGQGLALSFGVLTGSIFWSTSAAFGLAAILVTNVWLFELMRYAGAFYLLYLAYKSLRSALFAREIDIPEHQSRSAFENYFKGLLIHLTNPKAILFFGALYSVGVPAQAQVSDLISVIITVGCLSATIFLGYAVLFSSHLAVKTYMRSKVVFEGIFALFFGAAGLKLLTSKLGQ